MTNTEKLTHLQKLYNQGEITVNPGMADEIVYSKAANDFACSCDRFTQLAFENWLRIQPEYIAEIEALELDDAADEVLDDMYDRPPSTLLN